MTEPTGETGRTAAWLADALAAVDPQRVIRLARGLIDTPSPTGSELPAARALAAMLAAEGIQAHVEEFSPGRANLVAWTGGASASQLVLCGHLDTTGYGDERDRPWLHELGVSDRAASGLEDGVVFGLGAYNMKGGVAAAAEAVLAIASVAPRVAGRLTLAAVAGESEKAPVRGLAADYLGSEYEGGGVGAERLLEVGLRPDWVVICEPSGLAVANGQPGYVSVRLQVTGRAGYLPAPGTPTALTAAARVIDAVSAWGAAWAQRAAIDTGLGTMRPTTTIGAVEGGAPFKPGGPPSAAALYVDLRVPPGEDAGAAVASLVVACRDAVTAHGPALGLEADVYARNMPGAITPADHPLVRAAREARAAVTGRPATEATPDWDLVPGDDGKVFGRAGIPYVKVGPGSPLTRDPRFGREQVRASELVAAARLYVELAARMLA